MGGSLMAQSRRRVTGSPGARPHPGKGPAGLPPATGVRIKAGLSIAITWIAVRTVGWALLKAGR